MLSAVQKQLLHILDQLSDEAMADMRKGQNNQVTSSVTLQAYIDLLAKENDVLLEVTTPLDIISESQGHRGYHRVRPEPDDLGQDAGEGGVLRGHHQAGEEGA